MMEIPISKKGEDVVDMHLKANMPKIVGFFDKPNSTHLLRTDQRQDCLWIKPINSTTAHCKLLPTLETKEQSVKDILILQRQKVRPLVDWYSLKTSQTIYRAQDRLICQNCYENNSADEVNEPSPWNQLCGNCMGG